MPSLLDKIKDRAQASQARHVSSSASPDSEYVEKLAYALEYAAAHVTAEVKIQPQHQYVQAQDPALQKVAAAQATQQGFLANLLKSKIAEKQNTGYAAQAGQDRAILQNIMSRLAAGPVAAPQDDNFQPAVEVEEEVDPVEAAVDSGESGSDQEAVQAAVTTASEDSSFSLADVVRSALAAKGTDDSGAASQDAGPVKTAGARGKGPLAIGDATNLLREKLRNRIGSGK